MEESEVFGSVTRGTSSVGFLVEEVLVDDLLRIFARACWCVRASLTRMIRGNRGYST